MFRHRELRRLTEVAAAAGVIFSISIFVVHAFDAGRRDSLAALLRCLRRYRLRKFAMLASSYASRDADGNFAQAVAEPAVSRVGGVAWVPIHGLVDIGQRERRLEQANLR